VIGWRNIQERISLISLSLSLSFLHYLFPYFPWCVTLFRKIYILKIEATSTPKHCYPTISLLYAKTQKATT
jgi:hypothetical protein